MPTPSLPVATYRALSSRDVNFPRTRALRPRLKSSGTSDVNLSPLLVTRPASAHGDDDSVDHARPNPDHGKEYDLAAFAAALARPPKGTGADFMPNHVGIDPAVLRHLPVALLEELA